MVSQKNPTWDSISVESAFCMEEEEEEGCHQIWLLAHFLQPNIPQTKPLPQTTGYLWIAGSTDARVRRCLFVGASFYWALITGRHELARDFLDCLHKLPDLALTLNPGRGLRCLGPDMRPVLIIDKRFF